MRALCLNAFLVECTLYNCIRSELFLQQELCLLPDAIDCYCLYVQLCARPTCLTWATLQSRRQRHRRHRPHRRHRQHRRHRDGALHSDITAERPLLDLCSATLRESARRACMCLSARLLNFGGAFEGGGFADFAGAPAGTSSTSANDGFGDFVSTAPSHQGASADLCSHIVWYCIFSKIA